MKKLTPKEIFKKILIVVGGASFLFASVAGIVDMLNSSNATVSQPEELSPQVQLQKQAEGYELVLAKEPNNPFVLENLLVIYLELRDLEAALPLAEKLVALQPENIRYEETLATIKKGLAESANQNSSKAPSPEVMTTEGEK